MTDIEIKANAMLQELSVQRQMLGDRATLLAFELALARAEIFSLKEELKKLKAPQ